MKQYNKADVGKYKQGRSAGKKLYLKPQRFSKKVQQYRELKTQGLLKNVFPFGLLHRHELSATTHGQKDSFHWLKARWPDSGGGPSQAQLGTALCV